jgi:perosamine synthetase
MKKKLRLPRFNYFINGLDLIKFFFSLLFSDLSKGKREKKLTLELTQYFNVKHAGTYSSYRMGLYYYLLSLGLDPDDEVLLTPITIPDAVNILLNLGLKPVFVDMDEKNHSVCLESLKKSKTKRSKVLIVTHLSGNISDLDEICETGSSLGLKVVEDFSQAYGCSLNARMAGCFGDIGIGSLSSGKVLTSFTGGIVITNNEMIFKKMQTLSNHQLTRPPKLRFLNELFDNLKIISATSKIGFRFITYPILNLIWVYRPNLLKKIHESKYYTRDPGKDVFFDDIPVRRDSIPSSWFTYLSDWQSSVALQTLKRVDQKNKKRRELVKIFLENLDQSVLNFIPSSFKKEEGNIYYHLPLYVPYSRDQFVRKLFKLGIDMDGYGLNLCTDEEVFKDLWSECKVAKRIKYESVFIPLSESFSVEEVLEMAEIFNKFFKELEV